jgi:hypothetical protein
MCMLNLQAKLLTSSSNLSLIIAMKLETKENNRTAAIVLF